MNEIKVSFFKSQFQSKPNDVEAAMLNKLIAEHPRTVSRDEIKYLAKLVGERGCTLCPATFTGGSKSKANFEQIQLLALDFDNKSPDKTVSLEQVKERADYYDLPILFAYDTFNSVKHNKFRIVFLNDVSISNIKVAETMLHALHTIFPEADPQGKSAVQMYYGGRGRLYFDDTIPEINIESLFRNLTICLEDRHGITNIRRHTEKFSRETGLAITERGKFDVSMVYDISDIRNIGNDTEEATGAISDDNNSPKPFIIIIKGDGEKISKTYYVLNYGERSTRSLSVVQRKPGNHRDYRSIDLARLRLRCQLFREFEIGERKIPHLELFGIATNLINAVESGSNRFMEILRVTSRYDHRPEKYRKWEQDLRYMKTCKPSSCSNFCPYKDKCSHGTNMLARPKCNNMERVQGYVEVFDPVEDVTDDVYRAIYNAYRATDTMWLWYIIKAMTSIGKTMAYLRLMKENNTAVFLIAALTNILKNEIYERAVAMGLNVMKTPSLEEIKGEIPDTIWRNIIRLYKIGGHFSVHPYIHDILKKQDIPCLREYMDARERLKKFNGSVITTHRYLLNMSAKRLRKYDSVIIDEDIIKSVISSQCTISLSDLKALSKRVRGSNLSERIKKLLKLSATTSCIELESIKWEAEEDETDEVPDEISTPFDTSSFSGAQKFYIRRASKEWGLNEDTLVFIKPVAFKEVKHIMVSATVNEDVCRNFFGENKVNFYECKKAKYKGNLYQYPHKSMSRDSINNTPGIIQCLTKYFGIKDENVITHKGYGKGPLWIGNTEGSNSLEGEDILVAATPYHAEFLYKLVAHTMGLAFDENAEMKERLCTHNGHQFWIKTYEDDVLRIIHFWMMESELEQAVGRARLLWHNCTVHLCSRFPLSQTQILELNLGKKVSE